MEKPIHPTAVGKVSQIANLFQRKPIEIQPIEQISAAAAAAAAAEESHSARFNNARALFEKLGVENNSNSNAKMPRSGSRDDNIYDANHSDRSSSRSSDRSTSPPKRRTPFPSGCNVNATVTNNNCTQINGTGVGNASSAISVGNNKFIVEPTMPKLHQNISRLKSEDSTQAGIVGSGVGGVLSSVHAADKPEKPERKFNSRELIEKQKKWTSHFTKTKSNRSHSDPNRCDIIRTVPGTGLIPGSVIQMKENAKAAHIMPNANENQMKIVEPLRSPILTNLATNAQEKPPSPPVRHSVVPPEIKPRSSNKIGSPIKSPPLPPIPAAKPKNVSPIKYNPERVRSPTKPSEPPPPPLKSAAVSAALQQQRSFEEQQQNAHTPPMPPEKPRKKSIELIEEAERTTPSSPTSAGFMQYAAKRSSIDSLGGNSCTGNGLMSGASTNSAATPSPAASASSGPSSPVHTEDEKQENESTEKSEMQCYYNNKNNSMPRRRRSENEAAEHTSYRPAASKANANHEPTKNNTKVLTSFADAGNVRHDLLIKIDLENCEHVPPNKDFSCQLRQLRINQQQSSKSEQLQTDLILKQNHRIPNQLFGGLLPSENNQQLQSNIHLESIQLSHQHPHPHSQPLLLSSSSSVLHPQTSPQYNNNKTAQSQSHPPPDDQAQALLTTAHSQAQIPELNLHQKQQTALFDVPKNGRAAAAEFNKQLGNLRPPTPQFRSQNGNVDQYQTQQQQYQTLAQTKIEEFSNQTELIQLQTKQSMPDIAGKHQNKLKSIQSKSESEELPATAEPSQCRVETLNGSTPDTEYKNQTNNNSQSGPMQPDLAQAEDIDCYATTIQHRETDLLFDDMKEYYKEQLEQEALQLKKLHTAAAAAAAALPHANDNNRNWNTEINNQADHCDDCNSSLCSVDTFNVNEYIKCNFSSNGDLVDDNDMAQEPINFYDVVSGTHKLNHQNDICDKWEADSTGTLSTCMITCPACNFEIQRQFLQAQAQAKATTGKASESVSSTKPRQMAHVLRKFPSESACTVANVRVAYKGNVAGSGAEEEHASRQLHQVSSDDALAFKAQPELNYYQTNSFESMDSNKIKKPTANDAASSCTADSSDNTTNSVINLALDSAKPMMDMTKYAFQRKYYDEPMMRMNKQQANTYYRFNDDGLDQNLVAYDVPELKFRNVFRKLPQQQQQKQKESVVDKQLQLQLQQQQEQQQSKKEQIEPEHQLDIERLPQNPAQWKQKQELQQEEKHDNVARRSLEHLAVTKSTQSMKWPMNRNIVTVYDECCGQIMPQSAEVDMDAKKQPKQQEPLQKKPQPDNALSEAGDSQSTAQLEQITTAKTLPSQFTIRNNNVNRNGNANDNNNNNNHNNNNQRESVRDKKKRFLKLKNQLFNPQLLETKQHLRHIRQRILHDLRTANANNNKIESPPSPLSSQFSQSLQPSLSSQSLLSDQLSQYAQSVESSQYSQRTPDAYHFLLKPNSTTTEPEMPQQEQQHLYTKYRQYIQDILDGIANELTGKSLPTSNTLLERELTKYVKYLNENCYMGCILSHIDSQPLRREFLLFNLEEDLVMALYYDETHSN